MLSHVPALASILQRALWLWILMLFILKSYVCFEPQNVKDVLQAVNIPDFDWLLCLWLENISCEFIWNLLVTSRLHHHLRFDIICQFLLFSLLFYVCNEPRRSTRVSCYRPRALFPLFCPFDLHFCSRLWEKFKAATFFLSQKLNRWLVQEKMSLDHPLWILLHFRGEILLAVSSLK